MSLHTRAGGFEAINIPRTQEERIHARRTAISRLVDNNAYLFGIYPELHRLLPDPMGSMLSKRAWGEGKVLQSLVTALHPLYAVCYETNPASGHDLSIFTSRAVRCYF